MPSVLPDYPHALTADAVASRLDVDPGTGLSGAEVARRLAQYGANELNRQPPRRLTAILARQFRGLVVYILAGAAGLALAFGDHAEAVAILAVLVINGLIGFVTEWRAARSMEALRRLAAARTRVRRDGHAMSVAAQELVPGDIVLLEAGDVVTADLRLIRAAGLQADEAVLSGESLPVDKGTEPLAPGTALSDRSGMAWKGSAITRGSAEGVVVGTGMATEIGRISQLVMAARPEATPLEAQLDGLGRRLIGLMLALAGLATLAGLLRGFPPAEIVQTGVALAVAAVPEGLPVVATLSLARGMWRMARRNAIINRLSAVETLGATTLILTDKTGTLTENRMSVVQYLLDGADVTIARDGGLPDAGDALSLAIRLGALCNSADDGGAEATGDPMELALLAVARRAGIDPRLGGHAVEHAFDPAHRMMAQVYPEEGGFLYAVKGAPEAVLAACDSVLSPQGPRPLEAEGRAHWLARNHQRAGQGLRCLALAVKSAPGAHQPPYAGLMLVALVALADPLRPEVPAALAGCRRAGVRVVMMTGDHAATAARIARDAGISDAEPRVIEGQDLTGLDLAHPDEALAERIAATEVFARVTPEAKLALVGFFQRAGQVVAMTGDGVNDAPALSKADIGIAMGQRGTQVAREAADMVLRDDSFASIVAALREGRVIHDNIRTVVVYLMSCNISEILVVGFAVGVGLQSPLLPLQILFLNIVTDVFPALALGLGQGDGGILERPPRAPGEPILRRLDWRRIALLGGSITAATLAAFVLAQRFLGLAPEAAVSVAFLTLALSQLWNAFNTRPPGSPLHRAAALRDWLVWGAIALCLALLAAAMAVPALASLLQLPAPGGAGLALAAAMSGASLVLGSLALRLVRGE